jgi:integrase/recombinase XerD
MKNNTIISVFLDKISAEDGLSKNTILSYQKDLQLLEEFLISKKTTLIKASPENLGKFLAHLHEKNLRSSSIARKISCFKNFYRFLHDDKIIESNIAKNLEAPKAQMKLPKMLSEEEILQLLEVSNRGDSIKMLRLNCMLEILYSSGLRVSELVSLPISAIQNDKEYLIIKGKGNKERIAALNNSALNAIKKYLAMRNSSSHKNSTWMFVGNSLKGNQDVHMTRQGFHKALKELAKLANIDEDKVHPHVIRHSFASHLLNRGADLRVLQELLGHSDISTTQIYTHVLDSKLKDLVFNKHPLAKG